VYNNGILLNTATQLVQCRNVMMKAYIYD